MKKNYLRSIIDSTSGRPSFDELLSEDNIDIENESCNTDDDQSEDKIDTENESCNADDDDATSTGSTTDDEDDATSTGLFLCGPEEMMKSCKKASKGKKCFVYEERFS